MPSASAQPSADRARLLASLQALFTRCYHGAAAYALQAEPYGGEAHPALAAALGDVRALDERHARTLARLIDRLDAVPQAGAFAWWYRDLNYLTLASLGAFVLEALEEDVASLEALLTGWPERGFDARPALEHLLRERCDAAKTLAPLVEAAREEEAAAYVREREEAAKAREAFQARVKAAREAAAPKPAAKKSATAPAKAPPKAPAPPAAAGGDEDALDPKERARQKILEMRRKKEAAAGAPAPAGATPPLPDPNEEGISAKEKARRQILAVRAKKQGAAAPAPAAEAAPSAAALPDPDEEGISAKEKARRQILAMRAKKQAGAKAAPKEAEPPAGETPADETPHGEPKLAPPPTDATAPAEEAEETLPDPDEPGISPKEKARRQVMRLRAARKREGGAAAPAAPTAAKEEAPPPPTVEGEAGAPAPLPAEGEGAEVLPDPDEPGISPKEKARRQVMRMRARKSEKTGD